MLGGSALRKNQRLFGALAVLAVVMVLTALSLPTTKLTTLYDQALSFSTSPTHVNITAALTNVPPHFEGTTFTFNHGLDWHREEDWNQPVVGLPTTSIEFDDAGIMDLVTGEKFVFQEGTTFNLAVLRLPPGSKWDFVGVARGPTVVSDFVHVMTSETHKRSLIGIGFNIGSDGKMVAVTSGQVLDLPTYFNPACESTGQWAAVYGPEDPRLFWTDAGTPGLTMGRIASVKNHCRDIGFIPDLRNIFPALAEAIRPGNGVAIFEGRIEPGESAGRTHELVRVDDQGFVEKNWVSFYPDARPTGEIWPHIHYSLAGDRSLRPIGVTQRIVKYTSIKPIDNERIVMCLSNHHNGVASWSLHQATPLYRLTLCNRGCIPDDENTVYLTMGQIEARPTYAKFFATYSVTTPFEPLSVGPIVNIRGLKEHQDINYVLALQPLPSHDGPTKSSRVQTMPDHFFLDDQVVVTMGHRDEVMTSTVVDMADVLGGHRLCASDQHYE